MLGTDRLLATVLPAGELLLPVNMPTLDAPEGRLRKFKYRGKDASVSTQPPLQSVEEPCSESLMVEMHQSGVGLGAPGWSSRFSIQLWILAQEVISGW